MILKTMTFNLRFASDVPPNDWAARRPVASECLRAYAPDVVGTQEGLFGQIKDIAADCGEYNWIGLGREGGSRGEFAAVFYKPERLEPLAFDHFWLSDTPDVVGSRSWGNECVRMATWVWFRDLSTKREFGFWNTHFDHQVQIAREKSAALICEKVDASNQTPVVLVGDFNAVAGQNAAYDVLTRDGGFVDTWTSAKRRVETDERTFHNYGNSTLNGRIDWILTRGAMETTEIEIVKFERNGQFPSDHFPVAVTISLG